MQTWLESPLSAAFLSSKRGRRPCMMPNAEKMKKKIENKKDEGRGSML